MRNQSNITYKAMEAKFHVVNLEKFEQILLSKGANKVRDRVYELNICFDSASHKLMQQQKILCLRQDTKNRIMLLGHSAIHDGMREREAIEIVASDLNEASSLFQVLGFNILYKYEKYRKTYQLGEIKIKLDELPYGYFLEIEGTDPQDIYKTAELLGLNWETRVIDSYIDVFNRIKNKKSFNMRDLTFENFANIDFNPEQLGIHYADK